MVKLNQLIAGTPEKVCRLIDALHGQWRSLPALYLHNAPAHQSYFYGKLRPCDASLDSEGAEDVAERTPILARSNFP